MTNDLFFFFNDTATTEIYTLSLHDALPIFIAKLIHRYFGVPIGKTLLILDFIILSFVAFLFGQLIFMYTLIDRKSTRLNSSHANISYAVFCLKKKKRT